MAYDVSTHRGSSYHTAQHRRSTDGHGLARCARHADHPRIPEDFKTPVKLRIINLIGVVLPFAGVIVAISLLWNVAFNWQQLVIMLGMYLATALGITVGYHRYFTHRSFQTPGPIAALLSILGSMAVEGPVLQWVAQHRCHHQHSDHDHDPHSPHGHGDGIWGTIKGLWHAHMGWFIYKQPKNLDKYTKDLKKSKLIVWMSRLFPCVVLASLLIPAILGGLLTWSWSGVLWGFVWGGLVRISSCTTSLGASTPSAISGAQGPTTATTRAETTRFRRPGAGRSWHNNHHAFPTSARHGLHWWQIDFSYMIIWAMSKVGLASDIRVPSARACPGQAGRLSIGANSGSRMERRASRSAICSPRTDARMYPIHPGSASGLWLAAPSFAQSDRFADIELPIEPVAGEIALSGLRAWTWTDDSGPVPVHRVVLDDDVRVYLAGYEMAAETAVLWLSPRPELGPDVVQVFAHLTEVSTPEADATVALASDVLSIQGVIRLTMPVDLAADEIEAGADRPALDAGRRGGPVWIPRYGRDEPDHYADASGPTRRGPPGNADPPDRPGDGLHRRPPESDCRQPDHDGRGIVSLAAGRVIRTITDEEQAVVLEDGVNVTYREPGTDRVLELSAQRAVVFFATDVGPNTTSVRASNIDGIYMEGDVVASDGRYNLRGPRVFYDVRNDRALILDAVFSTFDTRVGFPLYVRARSVRQLSEDEFIADRASVSNTAFARPNPDIGARSVTIRQRTARSPTARMIRTSSPTRRTSR